MEHQGPSRTAVTSAMHRAAHLLLDGGKLLADPFARAFAGYDDDDEMLRAAAAADWPSFRRMRFQFALRNRYAEDKLVEATSRAIHQYVILGAGLDSFAYRRPDLMSCLDVFEVDHPASQQWKRLRVDELGIPVPARLHHLAIDFERQTLGAGLLESPIDAGRPLFVSLLGVTQYLTKDAVSRLLADLAGLAVAGSELIVQYVVPPATLSGTEAELVGAWIENGRSVGEPWLGIYEPTEMEQRLADAGFSHLVHLGPRQAEARYLLDGTDGICLPGYSRMIHARLG